MLNIYCFSTQGERLYQVSWGLLHLSFSYLQRYISDKHLDTVFAHTHGEFVHKVRIIYVSYEVDLRELKIVPLGEEKTQERPYCSLSIYKRVLQERESLVTEAYRGRAKNNGFRLDKMKTFFMMRVVRCWLSMEISQRNDRFLWDRLPREVVDALSVEVFNARLDGTFE